jgi:hypothetical protein
MIEKLERSSGSVIGYKISGTVAKSDYEVMVPEVEALAQQSDSLNMLLDMTDFKWEKVSAWGADFHFGREFRHKIKKMAIIGDKKWEEWLAKLASPFYAEQSKFFSSDQSDSAWEWLQE